MMAIAAISNESINSNLLLKNLIDSDVSLSAKGVFAFIYHIPKPISIEYVINSSNKNYSEISESIKELVSLGYLKNSDFSDLCLLDENKAI